MKRYVIIGNGVAGATAAEKIRANDAEGAITILSQEANSFYYRVRLPDVVAGEVDISRITLRTAEWYEKNRMKLCLNESAVRIDPAGGKVFSDRGNEYGYDELLLAVGARSFMPPVPGSDKKGVFALRDWRDATSIAERAGKTDSAVLIGGGLLGLETGYGLIRRGLKVRVVEFFDRLLPRQMDPQGAAKLQRRLEDIGFSFYLGAKSREIVGRDEAEGLLLEDDRLVSGGLILFSAGVRPNLDLARDSGLEVDKGVKVDDSLRSSSEHIWAAGDLIEHRGRVYGIWPAAKAQGEAAGINMAGGKALYEGTVMSNSLKVVGVDLTAAGNIDPENQLDAAVFEDEDIYRKIVMEDGRIVGFIFYGAGKGVKECQSALEKGLDVAAHRRDLAEADFDFAKLF